LLDTGTKLGPYEIQSPLGAGGMGEVYRARDTRLERDVAIKVLPSAFSDDTGRMQRFQQEARTLSGLNDPNLLAIYDVGQQDKTHYLVTEYLEGQTLAEKLAGGALSSRRVTDYALQVAKGLAAAHEKGVVHRDLKPDNIFVTRDDRVKILDFGLAKQSTELIADSEQTQTKANRPATAPGMVMGTAGYMSPEQVRGLPADARSDIFSFGVILYEMLSGKRAFKRDSGVETMNAILKEDPEELGSSGTTTAPGLERIIRRCLEKEPKQRFQSASDVGFAIEALTGLSGSSAGQKTVPAVKPLWRRTAVVVGGVLVLAAVVMLLWNRAPAVVNPTFERLTFQRGSIQNARFSPDGQTVVYSASWEGRPSELFATRPGSLESHSLGHPNTFLLGMSDKGLMAVLSAGPNVFWFLGSKGTLGRMPVDGGTIREVLEDVRSADISAVGQQFAVVRASGGRSRLEYPVGHVLYETDGIISHPRISPRGEAVAFDDHPLRGDDRGYVAVVDQKGTVKRLTAEWSTLQGLVWAKSGSELWFAAGEGVGVKSLYGVTPAGKQRLIWRVPTDLDLFDVTKDGRVLVARESLKLNGYVALPGQADRNISWLGFTAGVTLSPDRRNVFFAETGDGGGVDYGTFMRKTDGSPAVRLGLGQLFAVSHDGRWVLSHPPSQPNTLLVLPTGPGEVRTISLGNLAVRTEEAAWMPDDKGFYVAAVEPGHGPRMFRVMLSGGSPVPITPEGMTSRVLAPDGGTLVVRGPQKDLLLFEIATGKSRPLPGSTAEDIPIGWDETGRGVYLAVQQGPQAQIDRVEVASGRRQNWKTIKPMDSVDRVDTPFVNIAPRGDAYTYSVFSKLSDLYLVDGLK
jgi:serine/threonine protein kinase